MTYAYSRDDIARFWSKVDTSGDCWEWKARKQNTGYGVAQYGGRGGKTIPAHRTSYELSVGPIPDGLLIDHRCRNRGCVRPDHLRPVTRKQNKENVAGAQSNSTSGVLGVYWRKDAKKWAARIMHNKKSMHLGYFHTLEDAAEAARLKRLELFTHNDVDRIAA